MRKKAQYIRLFAKYKVYLWKLGYCLGSSTIIDLR